MPMKVVYGSYETEGTLVLGPVTPTIRRSPRGDQVTNTVTWNLTGQIFGTDRADTLGKMNALRAAFEDDFEDIELLHPDDSPSGLEIINDDTLSGVRVEVRPELDGSQGGATFLTIMPYSLRVTAVYDLHEGGPNILISHQEDIEEVNPLGAGNKAMHTPIEEKVQIFKTSQYSPIFITQTGTAVGWSDYPEPNPPKFAGREVRNMRRIRRGHPQEQWKRGDRMFPISWQYTFWSNIPVKGEPDGVPDVF